MTSCKEIKKPEPVKKRTVFQVEIDISDSDTDTERKEIVENLKGTGWGFVYQLANIIEKG